MGVILFLVNRKGGEKVGIIMSVVMMTSMIVIDDDDDDDDDDDIDNCGCVDDDDDDDDDAVTKNGTVQLQHCIMNLQAKLKRSTIETRSDELAKTTTRPAFISRHVNNM